MRIGNHIEHSTETSNLETEIKKWQYLVIDLQGNVVDLQGDNAVLQHGVDVDAKAVSDCCRLEAQIVELGTIIDERDERAFTQIQKISELEKKLSFEEGRAAAYDKILSQDELDEVDLTHALQLSEECVTKLQRRKKKLLKRARRAEEQVKKQDACVEELEAEVERLHGLVRHRMVVTTLSPESGSPQQHMHMGRGVYDPPLPDQSEIIESSKKKK